MFLRDAEGVVVLDDRRTVLAVQFLITVKIFLNRTKMVGSVFIPALRYQRFMPE
jgi:hypothetical protein